MEILIAIISIIAGFLLDRAWEWWKKKQSGLTGQAHEIIKLLGNSVQAYDGHYYLSRDPTQNFKIVKHVYEHCSGDVIATCFREDPSGYQEHDLARLLPRGTVFTRITNDRVCTEHGKRESEDLLRELVPNSSIIIIPSSGHFCCIDGIFCELPDETSIAFVTFPKIKDDIGNRGIIFYGHTARAFYEYFRDVRDTFINIGDSIGRGLADRR